MRMYAHMSIHVCMCVTAECIILHVLCMCVDTGAPMAGRIMSLQQPHQNLIYSHENSVLGKQDAESLEGAAPLCHVRWSSGTMDTETSDKDMPVLVLEL